MPLATALTRLGRSAHETPPLPGIDALLFDWVQKYSYWILSAPLLLLVVSTFGVFKLTVTPDNRVFYGSSNEYFQEFLEFESNYTPNNNILFVISAPVQVNDPDYASAIRWITDHAWDIENVIRVDSLATYPLAMGERDSLEVTTLLDHLCPTNDHCIEERLGEISKPQVVNRLISPSLRSTGVVATLSLEIGVIGVIEKITAETEALASAFAVAFPDYELVVTGGVPMMQAFASTSQADLSVLLPIALLSIFLLLVLFFGGLKPAIYLIVIASISIYFTLGFAGWTGHTINSATSIVPLIVFTLVVASSMHILLHFLRLSTDRPDDIKSASKAALEGNFSPMIVSSATSIIGLLSLTFLDSPPLRQLGYLSAFGLLTGTTLSILALPILLSSLHRGYRSRFVQWIQQKLNAYARVFEDGRSFAGISILILAISLVGIWKIEINDNFVEYFSESTQFRQNTDRATELLAGPNHIEILLANEGTDGIFNPGYIDYLEELTRYVRNHSAVSNASSFSDILNDLSDAFDLAISGVATADDFAQWYLVYEMSLQHGQSNTDFVRVDQVQTRISALLRETTSLDIQDLESDIYAWHASNSSGFDLLVTGENIPVAHLSELNIKSMITGICISIMLTALIVGVAVRRPKLGVVTLTATLLPIAFGFGIWGLVNGTIGLASTLIIALTLGIVVDDAVHMVYRFLDARRRLDFGPWQAAAYSLHRVGTAITTTSIVMIGGLSALLFSPFRINSSFGACTCLIIAVALFFDLLVFPRLLVWADTNNKNNLKESFWRPN